MSRSPTHPPANRSGPDAGVASSAKQRTHVVEAAPGQPETPADEATGTDLPIPHERDQAGGQVNPEPADSMVQAHRDLEAGQVDTDMRATAGLDAERRAAITPPAKGADTRTRPGGTSVDGGSHDPRR